MIILTRNQNMLLFLFYLAVTLSFLVAFIFMTRDRDPVNRWLSGGILLSVAFQCMMFFVMATGRIQDFWFLFRIACPFYYLTPPLVYIYARHLLKKEPIVIKNYIIDFIPFLITIVDIAWLYMSTTPASRMMEISIIQEDPSAEVLLGAGFIPAVIHYYARLIQRIYYISRQWKLLIEHRRSSKVRNSVTKWIFMLTTAQSFIVIGYALFATGVFLVHSAEGYAMVNTSKKISVLVMCVGLIVMCLYLFINPEILYGTPRQRAKSDTKPKKQNDDYDWLPAGTNIEEYCSRLEQFMETEKPYLSKRITVSSIATQIDIPAHLLSAILNRHYGKSFSDFINEYRIRNILRRIKDDPNWELLTIEGIAMETGFSSRAGFYTSFKKLTGESPRAYFSIITEEPSKKINL
jgi:AraC-like DNA-binding protein